MNKVINIILILKTVESIKSPARIAVKILVANLRKWAARLQWIAGIAA